MASSALRVGTRGSRLALWQTDHVAARLEAQNPGLRVERVVLKTVGDRVLDQALSRIGDKGLFTRELEEALRSGAADIAVHSLKDLPTADAPGLMLGAVLEREDPRDALIGPPGLRFAALPRGSRLGTSSLRRRAQLLALRPDFVVLDLRGNVPTRVEKVLRGDYAAAVLAYAGVKRLGLEAHVCEVLEPDALLPAVGQGAIAVQRRRDDDRVAALIAGLDHRPTRLATAAERALLARLEGGCQVPIGALAELRGEELELRGLIAALDGVRRASGRVAGPARDEAAAAALGVRLAERLLGEGGDAILASLREAVAPMERA
jgi:hydroxymethylbilane synthase